MYAYIHTMSKEISRVHEGREKTLENSGERQRDVLEVHAPSK